MPYRIHCATVAVKMNVQREKITTAQAVDLDYPKTSLNGGLCGILKSMASAQNVFQTFEITRVLSLKRKSVVSS